jgi:ubiquinone/menaquinone biosynthesis C-methylase UbiE
MRAEARGVPILDIGVGAGRTVAHALEISSDYVGIDYTTSLLESARRRFPGVCLEWGDARDLSRFRDAQFGLVIFSYNGLDSMVHADRLTTLREIHRVHRHGGKFVFSTHNADGPGHTTPYNRIPFTLNAARLGARLVRYTIGSALSVVNRARFRQFERFEDEYSIRNCTPHNNGLMIYFTSLETTRRQLEDAGFRPNAPAFGNVDGRAIDGARDSRNIWVHLIAEK